MRHRPNPRDSDWRLTEKSLDDPSFGAVEDPARSALAHAERFGEFSERTLARALVVPALDRLDDKLQLAIGQQCGLFSRLLDGGEVVRDSGGIERVSELGQALL